MTYYILTSFVLSLCISYIILPKIMKMLIDSSVLCENYKSDMIPTSIGLEFIFTQVITIGIMQIFFQFDSNFNFVYLLGFVFIGDRKSTRLNSSH